METVGFIGLGNMGAGMAGNLVMPMTNLSEQIVIAAMNRGWGALDNNAVFRLQEEAASVEVRAPGVDPTRAARFITTHPDA